MSLTIINKSQSFFDELSPFMSYIEDEVNVAEVKNEIQTEKFMKYEALPNLPTLGPKFKGSKDFKAVVEEIKKLSHEALEKCKADKSVRILSYDIQIVPLFLV